jgi:hypothetical protein
MGIMENNILLINQQLTPRNIVIVIFYSPVRKNLGTYNSGSLKFVTLMKLAQITKPSSFKLLVM